MPWKQPHQWAWWFDRRDSPKWRVPYLPPEQLPRTMAKPLSVRDAAPAERARARQAAKSICRR